MGLHQEFDLTLTPQQKALKDAAHRFAETVLRPNAEALDRLSDPQQVIDPPSPLWTVFKAAYAQGFHTALIPVEHGGLGLSGLSLHLAIEELSWGSADFGSSLAVTGFPYVSVLATGRMDLIEELIVPFVADKEARHIGCWAITEPLHGSDQLMAGTPEFHDAKISGQVTARQDGNHYIINGEKATWVSNGTIATHAVTYLSLDASKGMAGGGVAFIPLDLSGVSKGKPLNKLGQRALNQGSIRFQDVRIPKRYLLVDSSKYEAALENTLVLGNGAVSTIATGIARAAYEHALTYCQTRIQGGKPISQHQLVQKHLFDMFTKVEACRALSRAAMTFNAAAPQPALEYSIAAKTYCTQASLEVADTAIQLLGGNGLNREYPVEKLYRDARATLLEDGANDILALMGAQRLLKRAGAVN
jgi:alkylation response protein AidB-like acyl-CoA dehydrogenase